MRDPRALLEGAADQVDLLAAGELRALYSLRGIEGTDPVEEFPAKCQVGAPHLRPVGEGKREKAALVAVHDGQAPEQKPISRHPVGRRRFPARQDAT